VESGTGSASAETTKRRSRNQTTRRRSSRHGKFQERCSIIYCWTTCTLLISLLGRDGNNMYVLGPYALRTKSDIKRRCSSIKDKYVTNTPIRGEDRRFLCALFQWHHGLNSKTNGHPIHQIKLDWYHGRKSTDRVFWIRTTTSEWTVISSNEAIEKRDYKSVMMSKFVKALRLLIDPQVQKFRSQCGHLGGHIDHHGNLEFRHLVEDFSRHHNVDVCSLQYRSDPEYPFEHDVLVDADLVCRWTLFHEQNASLRWTTVRENLTKKRKRTDQKYVQSKAKYTWTSPPPFEPPRQMKKTLISTYFNRR
jgi:hypothetical protein